MEGWISVHRKIEESEIWFAERFDRAHAWLDLLLLAAHRPRTFFVRGIPVKIERGQLAYSQLSLAKRWQWNFKSVVTFLKWLESRQMVETKTSNITTIITVLNYAEYQNSGDQSGDQNGDQTETRTETYNNVNNVNNVNKEKIPCAKKLKKTENPDIKILIDYAFTLFQKKTGQKMFINGGKDGVTVKRLLQTYTLSQLQTLWDVFIESPDPFINKSGFTIGVFASQINKLLTLPPDPNTCIACKRNLARGEISSLKNTPQGGLCHDCDKKRTVSA